MKKKIVFIVLTCFTLLIVFQNCGKEDSEQVTLDAIGDEIGIEVDIHEQNIAELTAAYSYHYCGTFSRFNTVVRSEDRYLLTYSSGSEANTVVMQVELERDNNALADPFENYPDGTQLCVFGMQKPVYPQNTGTGTVYWIFEVDEIYDFTLNP